MKILGVEFGIDELVGLGCIFLFVGACIAWAIMRTPKSGGNRWG